MKTVCQLDASGYFIGLTVADESPKEPGVFLMPARTVDAAPPVDGFRRAKWGGSGWLYDQPVEPSPAAEPLPPPVEVSMRQARLALLSSGRLADVNAVIAGLPDALREAATIEWEYAPSVRRDSPLVAAVGAALSLSESQLDDLFRQAVVL